MYAETGIFYYRRYAAGNGLDTGDCVADEISLAIDVMPNSYSVHDILAVQLRGECITEASMDKNLLSHLKTSGQPKSNSEEGITPMQRKLQNARDFWIEE